MRKHYKHIELPIIDFFKEKGVNIAIEPSASRGADIVGISSALIGEAKHEKELRRDLDRAYWTNWNSTRQKFGGKPLDYRLAEHVPVGVCDLSNGAKGWVAVICGQLRHMVNKAKLTQGWIIYENFYSFEASLMESASFLREQRMISFCPPEHRENVGFLRIDYLSDKN